MSDREADTPNKGEASVHQETVSRGPSRRVRILSRKALENETDQKRREIDVLHKMLKDVMRSSEELKKESDLSRILRDLEGVS